MTVRCKFTVDSVAEHNYEVDGVPMRRIKLRTSYDPSIPEDKRFQKATPDGTLEFTCTNPAAIEQLKPGRSFYLDLVPTED